MNTEYEEHGYYAKRNFLSLDKIEQLKPIVDAFHESWIEANQDFYQERAINSAFLTGKQHMNVEQRTILFQLIGSKSLMEQVYNIIPENPAFMNTQLFFNPLNPAQNNYWHRDIQYDLNLKEQKSSLSGPQALHFRIALKNEPGIELVPGSHINWDTQEELDVRLERNGKKSHDDLSSGQIINLNAGDLLIFSGKMIHRGLYGLDRLSLDLLFCDTDKELLQYANPECLPDEVLIKQIDDPTAFINTIQTLNAI